MKPLAQGKQGSLYGFGVPFEGTLAPAIVAVLIGDFDEEPTGKDAEVLDGLDDGHGM